MAPPRAAPPFEYRATLPDADAAARESAALAGPLAEYLKRRGASPDDENAVRMAVEELFTNLGKFGRARPDDPPVEVELALEAGGQGLRLALVDSGPPFDSTTPPEPDLDLPLEERPIGGLGLFVLARLFPDRSYRREGGRNHTVWRRSRGAGAQE